LYSPIVMDHFSCPRHVGRLEPSDVSGCVGRPGGGPFVLFTVRLAGGLVSEVRFQTFGCGPAIAASSLLTELVAGRPLDETARLSAADLLLALEEEEA